MKISVIGTGFVGLVSSVCLAEKGHQVFGVDIDRAKVDLINGGRPPIYERGLAELLQKHIGVRLRATTDLYRAVQESDLSLIAVGTPFDGMHIDLTSIKAVSRQIGEALKTKAGFHVVVVKSTVVPGTTDEIVTPILAAASQKKAGVDFGVGMNPEFLTEGEAVHDFMCPDRIVLGGMNQATIDMQAEVYAGFTGVDVLCTNNKTAEMIKYASNALLATMISFSNELANLCTALQEVDIVDVLQGVHLSRYLRVQLPHGESYAPDIRSFLGAGCGFGGSCLPKDVKALVAHGVQAGVDMQLLEAVLRINEQQPRRMLQLIKKHFPALRGVRVAILGLAFRPDTNDMRESPAIPIIRLLLQEGAVIQAYDPAAAQEATQIFANDEVRVAPSLRDVLRGAEVVVLVTRWDEFQQLPALLQSMASPPLVVDGRRMLAKQAFAHYEGIGV
jgi:UDPglucose 6-dehydrogenase/GDP-mannose 6-dehydrogenase